MCVWPTFETVLELCLLARYNAGLCQIMPPAFIHTLPGMTEANGQSRNKAVTCVFNADAFVPPKKLAAIVRQFFFAYT